MIKAERHDRIISELVRRGAISALELGEILTASIATVRRDIAELDEKGAVVRTHGGVTTRSCILLMAMITCMIVVPPPHPMV